MFSFKYEANKPSTPNRVSLSTSDHFPFHEPANQ